MLKPMLTAMRHRGPNGAGFIVGDQICRAEHVDGLGWEDAHGPLALGHTRLAVVGGPVGAQPFVCEDGPVTLLHNGEIYNYQEIRPSLEEKHQFTTRTDSEVLAHLVGELYDGDLTKAVEGALERCDGVYAVAVTDGREVVIARDIVGVRQLYLAQDGPIFAFASEKKALWALGLDTGVERLLPGQIITVSPGGTSVRRREPSSLLPDTVAIDEERQAMNAYREALEEAMAKRIQNQDRVGIIFSGGIDSLLVAHVAKRLGANIACYAAGSEHSSDLRYAKTMAEGLGMELRPISLTEDRMMELTPEIIGVIEDRSFGQVEVALPVFAAIREASADGQLVLLTGQGADELFGGYPWYRAIVEREGYDEFHFRMQDDLLHLYKETLEREDKMTMAHSIELRVPFLDPAVIRTAMSIAPQLKIRGAEDRTGKHVHRELAVELGIPKEWAMRPKEAAQHGAGIHDIFDTLARRHGFAPEVAKRLGYSSLTSLDEQLGSSARYGYRYGDHGMWGAQDHVQLFLDWVASENGLLNGGEQKKIEGFLSRVAR